VPGRGAWRLGSESNYVAIFLNSMTFDSSRGCDTRFGTRLMSRLPPDIHGTSNIPGLAVSAVCI